MRLLFLLTLTIGFTGMTAATRAQDIPAGGMDVVNGSPDGVSFNDGDGQYAKIGYLTEPGLAFDRHVRVQTLRQPPNTWNVQVKWVSEQPIKAGDALLVVFSARAVETTTESGDASIDLSVQLSRTPWDGIGHRSFSITGEWKQYVMPMSPKKDFGAGDAQFAFNMGFRPQTVDIGGVRVINYGTSQKLSDLPITAYTYAGREHDAPWRKEAEERIEQIRKADLVVQVLDGAGNPIPGAEVQVRMKRHAFGFGTCVVADVINGAGENNDRYRETLGKYFNKAVFENDLKWPNLLHRGKQRWGEIDRAIAWLKERNFEVRGHTLVWPGKQWLPEEIKNLTDPAEIQRKVREHILEVGQYFAGRLDEWDVINEPVANHHLQDVVGRHAMVDWFTWAREADPHARLFLNDYTMLSGGAKDQKDIDAFYENVKFLLDHGAPVQGIGEQGHFAWNATTPARMLELLDRFAQLGLPIQITEYDMNVTDEDLQADYLRDFYTAAFSHPSVTGILMWGFWEGRHWMPDAAPWRRDWTPRKHAEMFIDLTTRQWWTSVDLTTGSDGSAKARGFLGSYDITVRHGGHSKTVHHTLRKDTGTVEVSLDR